MVFIKLLGILDLLAGITLVSVNFGYLDKLSLFFGVLLILKGFFYLKSFVSSLDILSGIVIFIAVYGYFNIITWLVVIFLIQKGIFSLFS